MLARILADNPGPTFTRNLDAKFVDTLKDLLKNGRDLSVRQMLMETLDQFEHQKGWDEGLAGIIAMWKKEKDRAYKTYGVRGSRSWKGGHVANVLQGRLPPAPQPMMSGPGSAPPPNAHSQNYFARSHTNRRLPDPVELANRLEEARTSAGLLTQLVANTPSTEVQDNDLVKEFADRCLSASRSIQMYMTAENPGPDNETMENLIDVNEALQQALNSQKRALLSARKEHGDRSQNPSPQPGSETNGAYPPPVPAPGGAFNGAAAAISRRDVPRSDKGKGRQEPLNKGKGREGAPDSVGYVAPPPGPPPPGRSGRPTEMVSPLTPEDVEDDDRNPFLDPHSAAGISEKARGKAPAQPSALVSSVEHTTPVYEQYHPGFRQSTQSYLGRQESATGKVQMHGAVDLDESDHHLSGGARPVYAAAGSDTDESPVIPRKTQFQYDNNAYKAGGTGAGGAPRQHRYANEVDEEDIYHNDEPETRENVAAGKRPVYRY